MPRFPRALVALLAALVATLTPLSAGGPASAGTVTYGTAKVVGNLNNVAAFAIAPNGDIFLAERITGKIKIWDSVTKQKTLFATVPDLVGSLGSENGLVGIALHPNYASNGYVYVYATRLIDGTARIHILRYTNSGGQGTDQTLIHAVPGRAGSYHIGGQMTFGPDGKLYVIVGERFEPKFAQDLSSERGKVLRMNADGSVPGDNPFSGSRVYAYGMRNGYGLDFDPVTDILWLTHNGPECNDEIEKVVPGGNYAWGPHGTCDTPPAPPKNTNQDGPDRRMPKYFYENTRGLTGMVFCDGCHLDAGAEGKLFWGDFNTGRVSRAKLTPTRGGIDTVIAVHTDPKRVLSMETGPDGRIHYSNGGTIFRLVLTTP